MSYNPEDRVRSIIDKLHDAASDNDHAAGREDDARLDWWLKPLVRGRAGYGPSFARLEALQHVIVGAFVPGRHLLNAKYYVEVFPYGDDAVPLWLAITSRATPAYFADEASAREYYARAEALVGKYVEEVQLYRAGGGGPLAEATDRDVRREDAAPMGTIFWDANDVPRPGMYIGQGTLISRKGHRGDVVWKPEAKAARDWMRAHGDEVRARFTAGVGLPQRPTLQQLQDRIAELAAYRGEHTDTGIALHDSPGAVYVHGEWRKIQADGVLYDELGKGINGLREVLRQATYNGTRPYQIASFYGSHHVSVGSGGYTATDILALTDPYDPPFEIAPSGASGERRKATRRDEKDHILESLRAFGWTYSEGGQNEYITAPKGHTRLQIKKTAVRLQDYDFAFGEWLDGSALGSVKDVAARLNAGNLDARAKRLEAEIPPVRPTLPKKKAEEALRALDLAAYGDVRVVNAYRYGYAAGEAGLAGDVPIAFAGRKPEEAAYHEREIAAYNAGYNAGIKK